jgi:hypothetical protein
MSFTPSPLQTLVLFRLLFTGEEPKQSDVKQLTPRTRKQLVDAGFIELEKRGRAQHILLTDRAWAWASEHLDAPISRQARTTEAFEALLLRLKQFLQTRQIPLAGFMSDAAPDQGTAGGLSNRIREAAFTLSGGKPNVRVRLTDLRRQLADVSREDLDRALLLLQKSGRLVLMHLDDPHERTPEDDQAAIDLLGFKRHILYMER